MHVPLQASNATASTSRNNEEPPAMNRKMGQAYLEHSIAELESQLRQVRLMKQQQQQRSKAATERRACLLDISMLVYGLPVVRKWSRSDEYAELLLPIDGQSVLAYSCQEDCQLNIPHTLHSISSRYAAHIHLLTQR